MPPENSSTPPAPPSPKGDANDSTKAAASDKAATERAEAQKAAADKAAAEKFAAAEKAANERAAAPSDPAEEQRKARDAAAKGRAEVKEKGKRLYQAFMCPDVGLPEIGASMLAAHLLTSDREADKMGRTEAISFAGRFRQDYPLVWHALRLAHLPNFAAACARSEFETAPIDTLVQIAIAIRG